MMILGLAFVVLGGLGLFAGLAVTRLDDETADRLRLGQLRGHRQHAPVLASVTAPVFMVGLLLIDARPIPDALGALLLAAASLAIIVAIGVLVANKVRGQGSTKWAIVLGVVELLLIAGVIVLAVGTADLLSTLILFGFTFVLFGFVAAAVGVVWFVIALIRRRRRAVAAGFVWVSISAMVIGLLGVAVLAPQPPSVPESMQSAAELDAFLSDLVDEKSPPGISVVVVKDGETVYDKAFGFADRPNGIRATPDTIYHWYSTTKIVTAVAVMQLVEQGRINLDDPVSDYLSFFDPEYPSATSEPVTVAHLLNHSSGLPDNVPAVVGWLHIEDEPAINQTEFVQDKLPSYDTLLFEPGSKGVYTNVGYYVLGALIEEVTGQSYEDYVVEHVLDPLGMTNTRFAYTDDMVANAGVGAHPLADPLTGFLPFMDPPWPSPYIRDYDHGWVWLNRFLFDGNPPSGLIGPAPEMARLAAAILNAGELEGERILSRNNVEAMLNDRHVQPGSSGQWADLSSRYGDGFEQGLGWHVVQDGDRHHVSHGGGGPAFATLMRLYEDEDLAVVMLVNGTNLAGQELADAIADIDWAPSG